VLQSPLRGGSAFTARGAAGFLAETFSRVRAAGARGLLTLRAESGVDSRVVLTACRRAGVRFSVTARLVKAIQRAIATIPEAAWVPIPYWSSSGTFDEDEKGQPTPGRQRALFAEFSYHALVTDREGSTVELEADHRRHAEVEAVILDLREGAVLVHLPS